MSLFRKWLESLSRSAGPPAVVHFECGEESDFELTLKDALEIGEDPPPGTKCTAILGDKRESRFTVPRNWNAGNNQKEGVQIEKIVTAVVKATSEQTGMILTQVMPVLNGLSQGYADVLDANKVLRQDAYEAQKLAADRSLESVLATAQERASQAQNEIANRALGIGERVGMGLIDAVTKRSQAKRILLKLSKPTVEAIQKDIGDQEFAELATLLFEQAEGGRTLQ